MEAKQIEEHESMEHREFTGAPHEDRETSMQSVLAPLARMLRADVLVLLLIFAVFHYFKLSTFSIAIDDEYEALRSDGYNWIVTGRWASYLFLRYFVPQPILPFFPTFLFGAGLALSYPLLLACFGVRRLGPVHYLSFPLYAGFPTWIFLTSLTTASCWAGVAQLVVVLGVDRWRRVLDMLDRDSAPRRRALVANALASVAALAVAMGFYQAFLPAYVVLALGVLLIRHHVMEMPFRVIALRVLALAALSVLGIALHGAIDAMFRRAFGLQDTHYIEGFINLRALLESPLAVLGQTARSFGAVYAGRAAVYATDTFTFPLIILSGLAAVAFWRTHSSGGRLLRIALAVGILCLPFLQHLVNGGGMPLRTLVAIPSIFWMFAMLGLTSRVRPVALTAFIATILGLVQIVYASNLYFAAAHFARIHDQELASAVYARIAEMNPDSDGQKIYTVDIFGAHPFVTNYARPYSSTSGFSFFEWDGGNEERMLDYMRLIGYTNIRPAPIEQRRRDVAEFAHMPTWPARGSVRVVGDVTLIKLGAAPGFPLNAQ
jgi:hypothetical protein